MSSGIQPVLKQTTTTSGLQSEINPCTSGIQPVLKQTTSGLQPVPNQSTSNSRIQSHLNTNTSMPSESISTETINETQQMPPVPTDSLSTGLRDLVHDWESPERQHLYTRATYPYVPNGLPLNPAEGLQPFKSVPNPSSANVVNGATSAELYSYPSGSTYINAPVQSGAHHPIPSRLPPSLPTKANGSTTQALHGVSPISLQPHPSVPYPSLPNGLYGETPTTTNGSMFRDIRQLASLASDFMLKVI